MMTTMIMFMITMTKAMMLVIRHKMNIWNRHIIVLTYVSITVNFYVILAISAAQRMRKSKPLDFICCFKYLYLNISFFLHTFLKYFSNIAGICIQEKWLNIYGILILLDDHGWQGHRSWLFYYMKKCSNKMTDLRKLTHVSIFLKTMDRLLPR